MIINEKHDGPENALIVENYPYGFKRTKIRYWIETTKKGDRWVSQTLNPNTLKWNTPKKSTYDAVMVLTKDENGHINPFGLYFTTDKKEINEFLEKTQDYGFNESQLNQLRILKAYSKTYENVKFEIVTKQFKNKRTGEIKDHLTGSEIINGEWEEVTHEEHEKEQKEIKKQIAENVKYNYLTDKRNPKELL